jgi:hypothetical protein
MQDRGVDLRKHGQKPVPWLCIHAYLPLPSLDMVSNYECTLAASVILPDALRRAESRIMSIIKALSESSGSRETHVPVFRDRCAVYMRFVRGKPPLEYPYTRAFYLAVGTHNI